MNNERIVGIVKWFDKQKGFGFLATDDGQHYFVHHSAIIAEGSRSLTEGDSVEFSIVQDRRGFMAAKVRKL